MKRTTVLLIGMLSAIGVWPAMGQGAAADNNRPSSAPQQTSSSYVIGADDVLAINVWKEPELTSTLPVRADGMISLPLLNDVKAAGLTPMQLAADITEKLKKYLTDPHVNVTVTQMNSQRIFATGEVLHPGPINLLPNMNVLQALSACGFTQFANTKGIYVLRTENGAQKRMPINYKKLLKGDQDPVLVLKPGDTIVVP